MQPLLRTSDAMKIAYCSPTMAVHKALAEWAEPIISREGYGSGLPPIKCLVDRLKSRASSAMGQPASMMRRPSLVDTAMDGARLGCFYLGLPLYAMTAPAAFVASAGLSATHEALIQFTRNQSMRGSGIGQLAGLAGIGALLLFTESTRLHCLAPMLGCFAMCGAAGALFGAIFWAIDRGANQGQEGPIQRDELGLSWFNVKKAYLRSSGRLPFPARPQTWNNFMR